MELPTKICSCCKKELTLDNFNKNENGKYGVRSKCKNCFRISYLKNKIEIKKKNKEYREKNKDKIKQRSKKYREMNKVKISKKKKEYSDKNKEKLRIKRREYYLKNRKKFLNESKQRYNKKKEEIKSYQKEYNIKNRDKINARYRGYIKTKKKNDIKFKTNLKIRVLFSVKMRQFGIKKTNSTFFYTGIKIEEYYKLLSNDPLWKLYEKDSKNFHIDHIIPCSVYDFNNYKEISKCWNPKNLRIISSKENIKKSNSIDKKLIAKHGIENLLPRRLNGKELPERHSDRK